MTKTSLIIAALALSAFLTTPSAAESLNVNTKGSTAGTSSSAAYSPPVMVARVSPEYPDYARTKEYEGRLRLVLEVSRTGEVRSVEVTSSTVHRLLEQAAVEAAEKWGFRPAMRGDVPVESVVEVPMRFGLSGGPRSYPGRVRLR